MGHKILVINGSLGGRHGNTFTAMTPLLHRLIGKSASIEQLHLSEVTDFHADAFAPALDRNDAFVFCSGTYWDSWGSPMQRFLEAVTDLEAGELWTGKPAAVFITMHSVGGKEVLSRLQGVLSTFGVMIPPMSGLVYSLANHLALRHSDDADLWRISDLEIAADNLITAASMKAHKLAWTPWPVDTDDPGRLWFSHPVSDEAEDFEI